MVQGENADEGLLLLLRLGLVPQRREISRLIEDQPDCIQQGCFRRKFPLPSQGGKRSRKAMRIETAARIRPLQLQPAKQRAGEGFWLARVRQTSAKRWQEAVRVAAVEHAGAQSALGREHCALVRDAPGGQEFAKMLKNGARVEGSLLLAARALQTCLAFDAITAWQVISLVRWNRVVPETAVYDKLVIDELTLIWALVQAKKLLPPNERGREPPEDILSWVILLGRTVGVHPTNRQSTPGREAIWRAYQGLRERMDALQGLRWAETQI